MFKTNLDACAVAFWQGPLGGEGSGASLGVSKIKWAKLLCSTLSNVESFTSRSRDIHMHLSESPTPLKWDSIFKTLSKYGFVVIIGNDHFTIVEAFQTMPKNPFEKMSELFTQGFQTKK